MYYVKKGKSEQDLVNQYLKEIRPYPQLDKEGERKLLLEYQATGSREAMDHLITSNLRFVVSVAVRYQNQGLGVPELINEGNLGLIEAIKRFNPQHYSVKFISYAVWWIRQSIIKALYEKSRLVRVSAEKESKIKRIHRMAEDSLQTFGTIDYDFVARGTHSKTHEVAQVLSLSSNRVSMDARMTDDGSASLHDILEDTHTEAPDLFLDEDEMKHRIDDLVDGLTLQEKRVICYYFGVGHETAYNLEQIGLKMNISKERVRQIKKRALERMKEQYQGYALSNRAA